MFLPRIERHMARGNVSIQGYLGTKGLYSVIKKFDIFCLLQKAQTILLLKTRLRWMPGTAVHESWGFTKY